MVPENIKERIQQGKKFLVSTHINPDADGVGASVAVCWLLHQLGRQAAIVNTESLPPAFSFIEDIYPISPQVPENMSDADVWIVVDSSKLDRTGIRIDRSGLTVVNIDHHVDNEYFGQDNWVDAEAPAISAGMSLSEVIKFVGNTNSFYYAVVDKDDKLMGGVTLDGIRNTFMTQELNDWLIAIDIMEPVIATVTPEMPLAEAFERTKKLDLEHLPVVSAGEDGKLVGVLNCRVVHRSLSAEVLARQQKADGLHTEK